MHRGEWFDSLISLIAQFVRIAFKTLHIIVNIENQIKIPKEKMTLFTIEPKMKAADTLLHEYQVHRKLGSPLSSSQLVFLSNHKQDFYFSMARLMTIRYCVETAKSIYMNIA